MSVDENHAERAGVANPTNDIDASASDTDGWAEHRFSFRGRAGEYFQIWIVNVFLSIMTLGIYSAWAKVRNRRYFYTHTFLGSGKNEANFEYHARPISILIARIFVLMILTIGSILLAPEWYGDELGLVSLLFLFLFLPWAWVRGLSFNARNSSYGNVRFKFHREYRVPYLIYGAILLLVGWLIMPWLWRTYHNFKASNHQLGNLRFTFNNPSIVGYIIIYIALVVAIIVLVTALSLVFVGSLPLTEIIVAVFTFLLSVYLFAWALAKLFILFWQNVQAKDVEDAEDKVIVRCQFVPRAFAKVLFVNYIASVLSLGLAIPWARVRKTKFLAENMLICAPSGVLDSIIGKREEDESAFGEELDTAEGFDFDVGII